jgi:aminoglycoside phosphotransferase (APT) family kinase protein
MPYSALFWLILATLATHPLGNLWQPLAMGVTVAQIEPELQGMLEADAFRARLSSCGLPATLARWSVIQGGRSNLTLKGEWPEAVACVLRLPPAGDALARAHDVTREHRIVHALQNSGVPLAKTLAVSGDPAMLGSPWALYGFAQGKVLHAEEDGLLVQESARAALSEATAQVLAAIHLVEPASVGLGDLGPTAGYVERQLKRWTKQWEAQSPRRCRAWEGIREKLAALQLRAQRVSVVHGDYRLGNLMVSCDSGAIEAVLDWELCTLGDPLADLGYLLNNWQLPGEPQLPLPSPSRNPGFLSRAALLAAYERASGLDLEHVIAYQALGIFRLCAIVEGVRLRDLASGARSAAECGKLEASVDALAEHGLSLSEG